MPSVAVIGRTYAYKLMFVFPVLIILLLVLTGFSPTTEEGGEVRVNALALLAGLVWFLFLINSLLVSYSGFSLSRDFNKEVTRLYQSGFPIRSVEGFSGMYGKIRNVFMSSFFISITVLLSLITYVFLVVFPTIWTNYLEGIESLAILGNLIDILKFIIALLAISLILIAIGILILLSLPEKPALVPGALLKYYYPTTIPSQIDNFLSDSIFPFLDPITRMRWDEWGEYILNNLDSAFEPEEDPQTRLEIAREKILLFAYLSRSMPEAVRFDDVVRPELGELFASEEALDGLFAGKDSGITWAVLSDIIKQVAKLAPEIFDVVDRIIVELKDNLSSFKESDLWITVAAPTTVMGNINPFRILVFMLNKDTEKFGDQKRPVTVKNIAETQLSMVTNAYELHLDEAEGMDIVEDDLPLTSSETDIVGLLSRILQVGDAVWFQMYRKNFGYHNFNIRVEEKGHGAIFGRSVNIKVARDIMFYAQAYGGKLSALSGVALPVVGAAGGLLTQGGGGGASVRELASDLAILVASGVVNVLDLIF